MRALGVAIRPRLPKRLLGPPASMSWARAQDVSKSTARGPANAALPAALRRARRAALVLPDNGTPPFTSPDLHLARPGFPCLSPKQLQGKSFSFSRPAALC